MADKAFEWAKARGLCRKNAIHGEDEADIPRDEEWTKTREAGSKIAFQSGFSLDVAQLNL